MRLGLPLVARFRARGCGRIAGIATETVMTACRSGALRSIGFRHIPKSAHEVHGLLLKFSLQFGLLDALDNKLAVEWPRLE